MRCSRTCIRPSVKQTPDHASMTSSRSLEKSRLARIISSVHVRESTVSVRLPSHVLEPSLASCHQPSGACAVWNAAQVVRRDRPRQQQRNVSLPALDGDEKSRHPSPCILLRAARALTQTITTGRHQHLQRENATAGTTQPAAFPSQVSRSSTPPSPSTQHPAADRTRPGSRASMPRGWLADRPATKHRQV